MTQEEKQLLVKDLYTRLYTGTIVNYNDLEGCDYELSIRTLSIFPEESLKCYLRPMSSMTEEEQQEYYDLTHQEGDDVWAKCLFDKMADFCNERHLDYRGLIEKSLAIIAPEGMYKNE